MTVEPMWQHEEGSDRVTLTLAGGLFTLTVEPFSELVPDWIATLEPHEPTYEFLSPCASQRDAQIAALHRFILFAATALAEGQEQLKALEST